MTTLAADSARTYEGGERNEIPMIASDIIYEGAAVGIVTGTGHARPLAAGDKFAGFCEQNADNSAGAAEAINVRVRESGKISLAVSGAVITDKGQPVYATDDNAFGFVGTSGVFIGFVHRFVSAGVAIVAFDAMNYTDPHGERLVRETLTGAKTLDAEDSGKCFFVTATAVITLPSIADGLHGVKLVNAGAYGTVQISADPAALDGIHGPDITLGADKDLINTLATAQRGDYVVLDLGDADGMGVTEMVGTWAREA